MVFKVLGNMTRATYDFLHIFYSELHVKSEYLTLKKLRFLADIQEEEVPCCPNSCIAFTGKNSKDEDCPYCQAPRWTDQGNPSATFSYLPLPVLLACQWRDKETAKNLHYRRRYEEDAISEIIIS